MLKGNNISSGSSSPSKNDNIGAANIAMRKNENYIAAEDQMQIKHTNASVSADELRKAQTATQKKNNNIGELTKEKLQQAQGEQKLEVYKEKKKFNFKKWLKGESKQEYIENISLVTIIVSVVFLWFGMALGSFIKYTVLLAAFGCFLLLIGICIFIASQMIEKKE